MHAYLLIGSPGDSYENEIASLAKRLNAKALENPLSKIEDVRSLNNLIRLSFSEPTLIVAKNIHEATIETLNALLKNLEEPQENIYFALTSPTTKKVLGTIVSRCQVIKVKTSEESYKDSSHEEFLKLSAGQRLAFFDKIKDRGTAIKFVEGLIFFLKEKKNYKNAEVLLKTLTRLKANGTVNLHLSNLAINFK